MPNGTTTGILQLIPTFECISVYANFTGDDNANATTLLEYRKQGTSTWKRGMDMVEDKRATLWAGGAVTNPFANQWRGSIFGCTPNTTYDVRLTFADTDGVTGTNPVVGTVTTRNDNFQLGSGPVYYVAKNGSDSNAGTEAAPFLTIQKAINTVTAGGTIYIKAGTYNGALTITKSGIASNYITLLNYSTDVVIIDGDNASYAILMNPASYWRIRGLTIQNADRQGIVLMRSSAYNVFEYLTIRDFGYMNEADRADAGISICDGGNNNLIQYCTFYTDRNGYGDEHHRADGVSLYRCDADLWYSGVQAGPGNANVIRYNRMYSLAGVPNSSNSGMSDAVGGWANETIQDGAYKDCDIYGNLIGPLGDDGLELEGGGINVRAWGNTIYGSWSGFATACVTVGPLYVFRNFFYNNREPNDKVGWGSSPGANGPGFFYHNSFYRALFGTSEYGGPYYANQHYANNIWMVDRDAIQSTSPATQVDHNNSYDYDCCYAMLGGYGFYWAGTRYTSLASFRSASGQEMHAIAADPKFVDPANGDLRLQPTSPCIDAGVLIYGFNDADSPWPYKGNGPDIGAVEYDASATTFSLYLTTSGLGTTSPAPGTYTYSKGQVVNLQANPSSGWYFDHWEGNVANPLSPTTTITMNQNENVVAVFTETPITQYTLTISVAGQGTTVPASGSYAYAAGTVVNLDASPSAGWQFSRWEENGSLLSSSPQISITMSQARSVTAVFEQIIVPPTQHSLTISIVGDGTTNPPAGSYLYDEGTSLMVTATPLVGNFFVEWVEGVNHYTQNPLVVLMNADRSLVAVFEPVVIPPTRYTLTIQTNIGGDTVPAVGSYQYDEETEVQVTAIPTAGYRFVEWRENGTTLSTQQSVNILIDGDRTIAATFEQIVIPPTEYSLTISVMGNGTTDPVPGAYTYPENTVITVVAMAFEGYKFDHWEGDINGGISPLTITLDRNISILAVFSEKKPPLLSSNAIIVGAVLAGTIIPAVILRRK